MKHDVPTAENIKISVLQVVTPCNLTDVMEEPTLGMEARFLQNTCNVNTTKQIKKTSLSNSMELNSSSEAASHSAT
jgi:hypothetical protein